MRGMRGLRRVAAVSAVVVAGMQFVVDHGGLAGAGPLATSATRCPGCTGTTCSAGTGADGSSGPGSGASASVPHRAASGGHTGIPGSDVAVIYSNFPSEDASFLSKWKQILEGENYKVTEYVAAADGGPGTATLDHFVAAAKAGVVVLSTHGVDTQQNGFNGILVSEFTSQAALDNAWNADEKDPAYQGDVLKKLNFPDDHRDNKTVYSLWMTQAGVQHLFGDNKQRPADQLVFAGACWSNNLAAAFGATAYFGYTKPVTDGQVYRDMGRLLGRLDGTQMSADDRDTTKAFAAGGFTTGPTRLVYHAQPAGTSVALSPDVSSVDYPDGQDYSLPGDAGPFVVHFDTPMDTGVSPSSFLSVKGAKLSDASWSSSTELSLDLKSSTCTDICPVTITIDSKVAVSAGDFRNWLDGDVDPMGAGTGVYPNGDNENIPFAYAAWHTQTAPDPNPDCSGLSAVAAESPSDVWAVGSQGLGKCVPFGTLTEHWDGTSWSIVPSASPSGYTDDLIAVTAAGPKDYWAAGFAQNIKADDGSGSALVESSTGGAWTVAKEYTPGFSATLAGVSAAGPKNVWAVGYGQSAQFGAYEPLVMHDDNGAWTEKVPTAIGFGGSTELLSVDAVSSNDIWAAGFSANPDNNLIEAMMLHSTGGAFDEVALGGTTSSATYSQLDAVSAVSASNVWAVGYVDDMDPLIEHFNGKEWSSVVSGLPDHVQLTGVTAVSASNIWAIGTNYTNSGVGQVIIHFDGKKWSHVVTPSTKYATVAGLASTKSGYAVAVGNVNDVPFVEAFTPQAKPAARRDI